MSLMDKFKKASKQVVDAGAKTMLKVRAMPRMSLSLLPMLVLVLLLALALVFAEIVLTRDLMNAQH